MDEELRGIEACIADLNAWMENNFLIKVKLN